VDLLSGDEMGIEERSALDTISSLLHVMEVNLQAAGGENVDEFRN
jgi:hypothetical protein